jgi:hypothetical protein
MRFCGESDMMEVKLQVLLFLLLSSENMCVKPLGLATACFGNIIRHIVDKISRVFLDKNR